MGSVNGIVNAWDKGEKPCRNGENAVPEDIGSGYLLMTGKRVVECHCSYSSLN